MYDAVLKSGESEPGRTASLNVGGNIPAGGNLLKLSELVLHAAAWLLSTSPFDALDEGDWTEGGML
jgi:hypothetical protein